MPTYSQGAQTRVFFGLVPALMLQDFDATGIMVPPPNATVTLAAAASIATAADVTAGFQTLTINALPAATHIAAGTRLSFRSGTSSFVAELVQDATPTATTIRVRPLTRAIPNSAVANHIGLIQMVGGTTANVKVESEDESVMTFTEKLLTDTSTLLSGFKSGGAKSSEWSVEYESLSSSTDITISRMVFAAMQVTNGVRAYARIMDQVPKGMSVGDAIEGYVDVLGLDKTNTADSLIKLKTTLKGRGAPLLSYAA